MKALALAWTGGLLILVVAMVAAWAVQRRTGQGGWVDAFWSLGLGAAGVFAALAPVGQAAASARQVLAATLIAAWGLRLGTHLARRAATGPKDARYARLEADWGGQAAARMFGFLMLQAAAGGLLLAGVTLAARRPGQGLSAQDIVAAVILAAAILGEGLADRQLRAFKADPANAGRVCDRGLWARSRHPNYVFEWLAWCAWPVMAVGPDWPWGWAALSAPLYMYWLLTRVSGVPLLEAHMRRTRPEAFADYARRTPVFFPLRWPLGSGG